MGLHFHHIDGDASNTTEANLAVLCVRDHDAHHRPGPYRAGKGSVVNHLGLDAETIRKQKVGWEAFVAEASREHPAIVATVAAYGTEESVHSMKLTFQWESGEIVFVRIYHLHDGTPSAWADRAVEEVAWLGRNVKIVLLDEALPVEHCPCCEQSLTSVVPSGLVRRLTSPTWSSSSVCSVYVNPDQPSLALHVHDDRGEAFSASLHRCGDVLHLASATYEERVVIEPRPSVRAQASRIVRKLVDDWAPSRLLIGTGSHEHPRIISDLQLPACWEGRAARKFGRRSKRT